MFTLPALMLLGMPAGLANGTNRVCVLTQSISGVLAYRKSGQLDERALLPVLLPTLSGALLGSLGAAWLPEVWLKPVLLGTMVVVAALLAVRPQALSAPRGGQPRSATSLAGFTGLFLTGLYGGFIQAGVGFLLLSVLGGVLRYDLVRANALKLVCTGIFGAVAVVVFAVADQILWVPALILAAASVIGSILGVRVATRIPERAIRFVVFAAVLLASVGAYFR